MPKPPFSISSSSNATGPMFNGTKCSSCGRKVTSEPFASLGIGPVCYMRKYKVAAINGMAAAIGKEALDPIKQLANIGFTEADIAKANMPGFMLACGELSTVYRNVDASARISTLFQAESETLRKAADVSFLAINQAAKTYANDCLSNTPADPRKQLMSKAAVLCSGVNLIKHVAGTLTALGDEHISHHESVELRQSIQSALIESRLYAYVAQAERKLLAPDKNEQFLSLMFEKAPPTVAAPVVGKHVSPYERAGVNFGGTEDAILTTMAEKNPAAREILEKMVKQSGGIEEAVVVLSLLDDMNVRGQQIVLALDAANPEGLKSGVTNKAVAALAEAAWDGATLAVAVNKRADAAGVPHKAVTMGGQMGDRKLMPGYSHNDEPIAPRGAIEFAAEPIPEHTAGPALAHVA